ncbi:hypothetical protein LNN31_19010 [Acetobacterium wieringae]|uniref:Uncharacterized protein n=1 Tax=Acetobacterium wieringae TaxID=52694 RepID=A0ABY6HK06_9FIRM|nr:hypothetical protein [Acetobacterium wieringae]UYO64727.1 hypothetical protein LNN31_19010 [Acetobacterium wieringae]
MKVGIRKPSIKKSVKARTTGKLKRSVKKTVNPLYGKKGMGLVNDPKKAVYNKVYSKTTIGVNSLSEAASSKSNNNKTSSGNAGNNYQHKNAPKQKKPSNGTSWFIWGGILAFFALIGQNIGAFLIFGGVAAFLIWTGLKKRKSYQSSSYENIVVPDMELAEPDLLLEEPVQNQEKNIPVSQEIIETTLIRTNVEEFEGGGNRQDNFKNLKVGDPVEICIGDARSDTTLVTTDGDDELGDLEKALSEILFNYDLSEGAQISGEVRQVYVDEKGIWNAKIKIHMAIFA